MKWRRKSMFDFLILVPLLVATIRAAGCMARSRLLRQYPAPGQRVDIGGYRLHIHCLGEGLPTVVIEAGLKDISAQWTQVQNEAASFERVCAYDRAGLGWSDCGPLPRTGTAMVAELQALLGRQRLALAGDPRAAASACGWAG